MSGRLFLLLFFVLQMAGTAVALWLLALRASLHGGETGWKSR